MTPSDRVLFDILSHALGTRRMSGPVNMCRRQWSSMYDRACSQMVGALVYDSLCRLGSNMPEDIGRSWRSQYEFALGRFDAQLMTLNHLSAVLKAEGVPVLVLKGLGLALNYPQPQLRECVDVDVFCGQDFEKADDIFTGRGLCSDAGGLEDKHSTFVVDGIEVENHLRFTSECNAANIRIGNVLLELSGREHRFDPRVPDLDLPDIQLGMLHLVMHTLSHLAWSGIRFRHLCDVTAYVRAHRDGIDWTFLVRTLRDAGLLDGALALFGICNDLLGMGLDTSGWGVSDKKKQAAVLDSIIHPVSSSSAVSDPLRKFIRKLRNHFIRVRIHRIVYNEPFPDSILKSLGLGC